MISSLTPVMGVFWTGVESRNAVDVNVRDLNVLESRLARVVVDVYPQRRFGSRSEGGIDRAPSRHDWRRCIKRWTRCVYPALVEGDA